MSIANEIAAMMGKEEKRKSTHDAVVLRTDNDGTTWVSIPGGADETPCSGTYADAEPGDTVKVEISGGRATILGNATSPAATGRTVEEVREIATDADEAALHAIESAGVAASAAEAAQASASAANTYANSALDQLGVVQDVVGVLNWATEHGTFTLTQDTAVVDGKVYFTYDSQTGDYTPVVDPQESALSTYYELSVSEAMDGFIEAHLAVTSRGLWVLPSGIGSGTTPASGETQKDSDARQASNHKALLSSDGMYIYDGSGVLVAWYGTGVQIGRASESHVELDYHSLKLIDKEGNAYFHVSDLRDSTGYAIITDEFTGDGETVSFTADFGSVNGSLVKVEVDGVEVSDYTYSVNGVITFSEAPADGAEIVAYFSTNDVKAKAFTFGGRLQGSALGASSFCHGKNVEASGWYSHAEGESTHALKSNSHAEGRSTQALGEASHAEGLNTEASGDVSHAEGYSTVASGARSHAEGRSSKAKGDYSHAEGNVSTASGNYSHAEGNVSTASGNYSHAEGDAAKSEGEYSHAEGDGTRAIGDYSHAEGASMYARGDYSHAEGHDTVSYGEYSHAEGYDTDAVGNYSHSEGDSTRASGAYSHAEGYSTVASGSHAHAEGYAGRASGDYSHAEGGTASGDYSHSQNLGTIAASEAQTAIGKYNNSDSQEKYALIIGNGTANDARSNAFTVDWDGNIKASGGVEALDKIDTVASNINRNGSNPSSVQYSKFFRAVDKDGDRLAIFGAARETDGRTRLLLAAYNDNNGTEVNNHLYLHVAEDGTCTYGLSDPAAFCSALHVGDFVDNSATNVSTAKETYKDLFDFTLAAGTWVVSATAEFATNTTGRRVLCMNTTAGGTGISLTWRASSPPVSGGPTRLKLAGVVRPSSSTKYYLTSWQNSGGNLNVTGVVQAVRIK